MRGTDGADEGMAVRPSQGLWVREMTEADVDAVAEVRVRGWQSAYRGLMPPAYLEALSVAEDADRRREGFARRRPEAWELVAERSGEVVGWLAAGPARDADLAPGGGELPSGRSPAAELLALYVAPPLVGTGIGRALLAAGAARARARGFGTLSLWVVRGNARAQRFYERAEFAPDGAKRSDDVAGWRVPELRYRRPLP